MVPWAGRRVVGALRHPVRDVTWYSVRTAFVTDWQLFCQFHLCHDHNTIVLLRDRVGPIIPVGFLDDLRHDVDLGVRHAANR